MTNNTVRYITYKNDRSINQVAENDLQLTLDKGVVGVGAKNPRWKDVEVGDEFILRCNNKVYFGYILPERIDPNTRQVWSKEQGERWGKTYCCFIYPKTVSWTEFIASYKAINDGRSPKVNYKWEDTKKVVNHFRPWDTINNYTVSVATPETKTKKHNLGFVIIKG